MVNQLILGDNLEIMRQMPAASVDLVYLDPPFFSNRNYEVIWGDAGEVRSFQDRWAGGIEHYIGWLKERVAEMHRLLKPTGSIFLHCDYHANTYIRVYILDKIFGIENFRSEIIWQKTRVVKKQSNHFGKVHDTIYCYSKSLNYCYHQLYRPHPETYQKSHYNQVEAGTGRLYGLWDFTQKGQGEARIFGDRVIAPPKGKHWIWSQERINEGLANGLIIFTKTGMPRLKKYFDESKGSSMDDLWNDIFDINSQAKERIGYPTQKPEALLERIISASSNEGDLVFDPFLGGGTTVIVADRLNRRWIGIDQSVQAVKVSEMRLYNARTLFSAPFTVQLHKYDYDTLRYADAFEFESWIITQYGGQPNIKKRGDLGLDGRLPDGTPLQVKRSEDIGRNVVDNFHAACRRNDAALFEKQRQAGAPVGAIIAFSFGVGAVKEVARLKLEEGVIIRLVRVEEIVPIAKKPTMRVSLTDGGADAKGARDVVFKAEAESAAGIEFYAWDWAYDAEKGVFKPEVLLDKTGQQTHKFKPGAHVIAIKAVDNDGLETIEVIRLKINGVVTTQ